MKKKKQFTRGQESALALQFPIMTKAITYEETKQYHRKKLYKLSLKSLGQIPWSDHPNEEQLDWINRRTDGSARSWETWVNNGF